MLNLVFDYDGTLHNSIEIYAPAFRLAYKELVEKGFAEPRDYSDKEISYWLGFSAAEMWHTFMPTLEASQKQNASMRIGKEMIGLIKEGKAKLYPHALEILEQLKIKGYNLIFLSNCKRAYMEAHIEAFQLEQYFTEFYCSEDYGFIPKYEIFNVIKTRYTGDFIIIGDRFQDMEIAQKYQLESIGCLYGFGDENELEMATYKIHSLDEIEQTICLLEYPIRDHTSVFIKE